MQTQQKFLFATAGFIAMTVCSAMAGGYSLEPATPIAPPVTTSDANNGYYVEGNLGYARQDYFDNTVWQSQVTGIQSNGLNTSATNSNLYGGFSGGADLGYQINQHYAVELGWFYLPPVNVNPSNASPWVQGAYMTSWALYLDAKYITALQFIPKTDWFFKLGVAYRDVTIPTTATIWLNQTISQTNSDYVRPTFATGFDYHFTQHFTGLFQYAYFMGANNSFSLFPGVLNPTALGSVADNVFTLGLGYNF